MGRELERRLPDQVTINWWKEGRGRRIFIDYNQMVRDRTIASAYSVRANPRATVSAPLRWEEVPDVAPNDFDIATMPARVAEVGDLFAALSPNGPGSSAAYSIEPLLDLADKDERDHGHQDLPLPAGVPGDAGRTEAGATEQGPRPPALTQAVSASIPRCRRCRRCHCPEPRG